MTENDPVITNIANHLKNHYSATINNNNSNSYLDQTISSKIIKTIEKLIKNFDKKTLCILLLLFSIDFLKNEMSNILKNSLDYLKNKLCTFDYMQICKQICMQIKDCIYKIITYIYHLKLRMFHKQKINIIEVKEMPKIISTEINLIPLNVFWENLYDYISSNENKSNISCDIEIVDFKQNNKDEYEYTQNILNLHIKYKDISIKFNKIIENKLLFDNNNLKFKSSKYLCNNNKYIYSKNKKYNTILDLCPFKDFVKEFSEHQNKMFSGFMNAKPGSDIFITSIINTLHSNYNIISTKGSSYYMILVFISLVHPSSPINDSSSYDESFTYNIDSLVNISDNKITDKFMNFTLSITMDQKYYKKEKTIIFSNWKYNRNYSQENEAKEWILSEMFPKLYNTLSEMFPKVSTPKKDINTDNLLVILQSSNLNLNLIDVWKEFLMGLNNNSNIMKFVSDNNVNIYEIVINRKKIITKAYQNRQVIVKEIIDKTSEKNEEECPKNKTIIETVIEEQKEEFIFDIVVGFKLLNNTYKDFTTLYLKEYDQLVLTTTLNNFRNKQNIYRELGLPYKFGALLYGSPGTGKSSSIIAIASYLQKHIYYLDMNNITTNEELKNVFNKVNKEIADNGIIVMEDIDVMTNIVHKRSTVNVGDSKLTLECFLNLLQGTLTHDGSIFIATTNNIEILDDAFIRDGRFDIKIELGNCDHFQMNLIYQKFFKRSIPESLIGKIEEYKITPATFISKLIPYILTDIDDEIIIKNISNIS